MISYFDNPLTLIILPQTQLEGVYWFQPVRLSVCLSVCLSLRLSVCGHDFVHAYVLRDGCMNFSKNVYTDYSPSEDVNLESIFLN